MKLKIRISAQSIEGLLGIHSSHCAILQIFVPCNFAGNDPETGLSFIRQCKVLVLNLSVFVAIS